MPPAGGFEHVKYKRNLPARGPGAYAILGGVTAICAYGFYRLGKGNLEKRFYRPWAGEWEAYADWECDGFFCHTLQLFHRELEREKLWSRIHLVPLLMAEGDRDVYRRQQAALSREKEIMKDVPGWEAGKSVYKNPKYAQNSIVLA
ncbi:hypothetical protein NMY22_g8979 [Coprinellus aureogranulatus]|nr:hypothetical protein NMY22_g8979 [Coprinellus aureogranulatus]